MGGCHPHHCRFERRRRITGWVTARDPPTSGLYETNRVQAVIPICYLRRRRRSYNRIESLLSHKERYHPHSS